MPKEKRKRTPLHARAAARAAGVPLTTILPDPSAKEPTPNSIDAAVDPEFTSSYNDGPHLTKKEKRNAKRAEFLSKLDFTYNATSIEAKKKREAAKNLSVNLNPLTASLPELFSLPEEQRHKLHASSNASSVPQKIGLSSKGARSHKARKKIAAEEMQRFNAVLQHPAFRQNPLQTIHQHTQNTLVKRPGANTDQTMLVER